MTSTTTSDPFQWNFSDDIIDQPFSSSSLWDKNIVHYYSSIYSDSRSRKHYVIYKDSVKYNYNNNNDRVKHVLSGVRGGNIVVNGPKSNLGHKFSNTNTMNAKNDAENKPSSLWSIRILFLTYYASLGSLLPYLPVYYHSLGHRGSYIGILGAVNPFTTFLVAPLWGMLADRTNRHKDILKFTFVSSLLTRLCICLRNDVSWLVTTVFLSALLNAPVKSLLDSSVMNQLNNAGQSSSYGKLRLWGQVGFGLGSSLIGFMLHRSTMGYKVAFLMHALVSLPAMIYINSFKHTKLDSSKQVPSATQTFSKVTTSSSSALPQRSVSQGLNMLLHNTDALVFFFLVLVIGISSGVIENFAYVRMREVGGTGREMGISRFVSSAAGAPMFWFSDKLTGGKEASDSAATRILVLSVLCYAIRFFIYASMKHPLGGLPAEALRGATFGAFWSTATVYAHKISPPGLNATLLTILNAMYGGLGQSMGAVVGGRMQSALGTTQTFWYAGLSDVAFVIFFVLYKKFSYFRRQRQHLRETKSQFQTEILQVQSSITSTQQTAIEHKSSILANHSTSTSSDKD